MWTSSDHRDYDYLEWIARLTSHIPDRGTHLVQNTATLSEGWKFVIDGVAPGAAELYCPSWTASVYFTAAKKSDDPLSSGREGNVHGIPSHAAEDPPGREESGNSGLDVGDMVGDVERGDEKWAAGSPATP